MLKVLHTADLHLGKIFHEQALIEDQRFMLDALTKILADENYGVLLIAGDVYDRSIPAPDAVTLFGSFLGKLRASRPNLEILILPGNHDSSTRLGFGRELFAELGIHIVTEAEDTFEPILIDRAGERFAFFLLPFLSPGSLKVEGESSGETAEQGLRSQADLAREAALRLEAARQRAKEQGAVRTVLGAHLFSAGGISSDSERVFLGSAEQVPADLFAGFDYVALGHLHRSQQIAPNTWYAGSPLAYSFEEAGQGKVFLSIELNGDKPVQVESIPVRPLRRLRRLEGPFDGFFRDGAKDPAIAEAEGDYLEIALTDQRLVENPLALLRRRFPWLLSVKQDRAFGALRAAGATDRLREPGEAKRSPLEDFTDFLTGIYGEADQGKITLFRELLEETVGDHEA